MVHRSFVLYTYVNLKPDVENYDFCIVCAANIFKNTRDQICFKIISSPNKNEKLTKYLLKILMKIVYEKITIFISFVPPTLSRIVEIGYGLKLFLVQIKTNN